MPTEISIPWKDIESSKRYQSLDQNQRYAVKLGWFEDNIGYTPEFQKLDKEAKLQVLEGFFVEPKKPDDRGLATLAGHGLIHGGLSILESIGIGFEWLGNRLPESEFSDKLTEFGKERAATYQKMAEPYGPPEDIKGLNVIDNPELLGNASYWVFNVPNAIPSFLATIVPGLGAYKVLKSAGTVLNWSPRVIANLSRLGAAIGAGPLEGTQTYKEVLKRGGSEQEAARAGELMTLFSGALNALSFGNMFLGKVGTGIVGKAKKAGMGALVEGLTEGAEEPAEVAAKLLSKYINNEPMPDDIKGMFVESFKEAATVAPIAGVTGLAGGAVGTTPTQGEVATKDAITEEVMRPTPEQFVEEPTIVEPIGQSVNKNILRQRAEALGATPLLPEGQGFEIVDPGQSQRIVNQEYIDKQWERLQQEADAINVQVKALQEIERNEAIRQQRQERLDAEKIREEVETTSEEKEIVEERPKPVRVRDIAEDRVETETKEIEEVTPFKMKGAIHQFGIGEEGLGVKSKTGITFFRGNDFKPIAKEMEQTYQYVEKDVELKNPEYAEYKTELLTKYGLDLTLSDTSRDLELKKTLEEKGHDGWVLQREIDGIPRTVEIAIFKEFDLKESKAEPQPQSKPDLEEGQVSGEVEIVEPQEPEVVEEPKDKPKAIGRAWVNGQWKPILEVKEIKRGKNKGKFKVFLSEKSKRTGKPKTKIVDADAIRYFEEEKVEPTTKPTKAVEPDLPVPHKKSFPKDLAHLSTFSEQIRSAIDDMRRIAIGGARYVSGNYLIKQGDWNAFVEFTEEIGDNLGNRNSKIVGDLKTYALKDFRLDLDSNINDQSKGIYKHLQDLRELIKGSVIDIPEIRLIHSPTEGGYDVVVSFEDNVSGTVIEKIMESFKGEKGYSGYSSGFAVPDADGVYRGGINVGINGIPIERVSEILGYEKQEIKPKKTEEPKPKGVVIPKDLKPSEQKKLLLEEIDKALDEHVKDYIAGNNLNANKFKEIREQYEANPEQFGGGMGIEYNFKYGDAEYTIWGNNLPEFKKRVKKLSLTISKPRLPGSTPQALRDVEKRFVKDIGKKLKDIKPKDIENYYSWERVAEGKEPGYKVYAKKLKEQPDIFNYLLNEPDVSQDVKDWIRKFWTAQFDPVGRQEVLAEEIEDFPSQIKKAIKKKRSGILTKYEKEIAEKGGAIVTIPKGQRIRVENELFESIQEGSKKLGGTVLISIPGNIGEQVFEIERPYGKLIYNEATGELSAGPEALTSKMVSKQNVQLGVDKTLLLQTISKDIVNNDLGGTIANETLQNSLDAFEEGQTDKRIDIFLDADYGLEYDDSKTMNTIVKVTDNGRGMSEKEVKKNLLRVGAKGKSGKATRGGYGLAKAGIFLTAIKSKVVTVQDGVKTTLTGTREQFFGVRGAGKPNLTTESTTEPNGTEFELLFYRDEEEAKSNNAFHLSGWQAGQSFEKYIKKGILDENLTITYQPYTGDPKTFTPEPADSMETVFPTEKISVKGNKLSLYFVPDKNPNNFPLWDNKYYPRVFTFNKGLGLFQINQGIYKMPGVWEKLDWKIIVDFKKTPDVRSINYPFIRNRTELNNDVKAAIQKRLAKRINQINEKAFKGKKSDFTKMIKNSPEVNGIKVLIPFKDKSEFKKSHKLIKDNDAVVDSLANIFKSFQNIVNKISEKQLNLAITVDPSVHGFRSNPDVTGHEFYAINPFAVTNSLLKNRMYAELTDKEFDGSTAMASNLVHTMVHEYAHDFVQSHGEDFALALSQIYVKMSHTQLARLEQQARRFYEEHGKDLESLQNDFEDMGKGGSEFSQDNLIVSASRVERGRKEGIGRDEEVSREATFKDSTKPITQEDYDVNADSNPRLLTTIKQSFQDIYKDIRKQLSKTLVPISTRIGRINTWLMHELRKMEMRIGTVSQEEIRTVVPLLKKARKMNKRDAADFDYARKNQDEEKLNELIDKYDLRTEWDNTVKVLKKLRKDAIDTGLEVGNLEWYWPRRLKNARGFLKAMGKAMDDFDDVFDRAINEKAIELGIPEEQMDVDMKASLITNMILGDPIGIGITSAHPRKLKKIPYYIDDKGRKQSLNKFYLHSDAALIEHIYEVRSAVERRKFFGKIPKNVAEHRKQLYMAQRKIRELNKEIDLNPNDDKLRKRRNEWIGKEKQHKAYIQKYAKYRDYTANIAAYIIELRDKGEIKAKDQNELRELLKSRFHQRGTQGFFRFYKNLAYMDTMGSPKSALTQIGDTVWATYEAGIYKGLKHAFKSVPPQKYKHIKITREDVGATHIATEFTDPGTLGKALTWTFRIVGLEKVDAIGKEALLNSALEKYQKEAQSDPQRLAEELRPMFRDETQSVIDDLINGEITENVKYIVYSRLLDYQPVALSELPQYYLTSGNGRIFYMLKTFTIKQFDIFRREAITKIVSGNKQERIQGLKNLIRLGSLFVIANATADELKDFILGRKTDLSDRVADNILRLAGSSKFITWKARTEGLGSAMTRQILPPVKFIDAITKDIYNAGDDKGLEVVASVPIVGTLAYWHMGRGTSKREDLWDRRFRKRKLRLKKIQERYERASDKKAYVEKHRKELVEHKRIGRYQARLNKLRKRINVLKSKTQTPEIKKRIKRLEEMRTEMIKKYLDRMK